jgi:hypothetical protein
MPRYSTARSLDSKQKTEQGVAAKQRAAGGLGAVMGWPTVATDCRGKMAQYSKLWRELLEVAEDVGIAILIFAILFGLSVGAALIFHNI